jgi:hypothetical protein
MENNTVTFNTYIEVYPDQPVVQPMGQPIGQPIGQYVSHPVDKQTDYFLYKHYDNEIKDKINFYLFNYYIHNRHEYIRKEDVYEYIDERINCIQNGEESEEDLYYYNIRNIKFIEENPSDDNTHSQNGKNPNKRVKYN